jgi:hypothetical protein
MQANVTNRVCLKSFLAGFFAINMQCLHCVYIFILTNFSPSMWVENSEGLVLLKHVMLCYVTLRYVTLCYVMLRYVTLCYVMLCYVFNKSAYIITSIPTVSSWDRTGPRPLLPQLLYSTQSDHTLAVTWVSSCQTSSFWTQSGYLPFQENLLN